MTASDNKVSQYKDIPGRIAVVIEGENFNLRQNNVVSSLQKDGYHVVVLSGKPFKGSDQFSSATRQSIFDIGRQLAAKKTAGGSFELNINTHGCITDEGNVGISLERRLPTL